MVIFLVGYMGSGKSSIGKKVAQEIGWQFADMDELIEQQTGVTINEIFEREGEERFRELERKLLYHFAQNRGRGLIQNAVIATGGGTPCYGGNMELMNRIGRTLYLKFDHKTLFCWLQEESDKRPLLRGKNEEELLGFIERSLVERESHYSQATHTIDGTGLSDDQMCGRVKEALLKMSR